MDIRAVDWNGGEVPTALRDLPPGRYVVEPIDDVGDLTAEQEAGLRLALDQMEAGDVRPFDDVIRELRGRSI